MPRVAFTANLQRHVACPEREVEGATVGHALEAVFRDAPLLRTYIVDEQGHLRRHVVVYVDGRPVKDRKRLTDPVAPAGEICVFQALSGG